MKLLLKKNFKNHPNLKIILKVNLKNAFKRPRIGHISSLSDLDKVKRQKRLFFVLLADTEKDAQNQIYVNIFRSDLIFCSVNLI